MKKLIIYIVTLIVFLLFLTIPSFSQKEINIWASHYTIFDFNYPTPVLKFINYYTKNSISLISDQNGQFLFCTDGKRVYDKGFLSAPPLYTMKNGFDIGGPQNSFTQTLISPIPANDSIYYIFSSNPCAGSCDFLDFNYSIVNMKGNSGLGEVTQKKIILIDSAITPIAGVRDSIGKNIWIVSHRVGNYNKRNDAFYAYLITEKGIDTSPVISKTGYAYYFNSYICWSPMRFSPDGLLLAKSLPSDYYNYDSKVEIFNFNRTNGKIELRNSIKAPKFIWMGSPSCDLGAHGVAFSPNGRLLYVSYEEGFPDTNYFSVYQYDLKSGIDSIIEKSAVCLVKAKKEYYQPSPPRVRYSVQATDIQNAPNGEIFVMKWLDTYQAVIRRPNRYGKSCMYEDSVYQLVKGDVGGLALPNFIQSYVERRITFTGKCAGNPIRFSANVFFPDSVIWDFGDTASGTLNVSRNEKPSHIFSSPGKYILQMVVWDDGFPDTLTEELTLYPSYNITLDTSICFGDSIYLGKYKITVPGNYSDTFVSYNSCDSICNWKVNWKQKADVFIGYDTTICEGSSLQLKSNLSWGKYFWSTGDTTPSIIVSSSGVYWLIYNSPKYCPDSDTIILTVRDNPHINLGNDTVICEDSLAFIMLDAGIWEKYLWNSGGETSRYLNVTKPGFYIVEVRDSFNCFTTDSLLVGEDCKTVIYIPNVFVPNGINTVFKVYGIGITEVEIKVFNRWGELIFKGKGGYNTSWDGIFRNEICPSGVYLYLIIARAKSGEILKRHGLVQLIK